MAEGIMPEDEIWRNISDDD